MIRVRRGAYLYSELKLEASISEFSELRSLILSFCEATEHAIEVPSEL